MRSLRPCASPRSASAASRRDSVEAARAFGSTAAQTLFKVQLPLARRQLLLSVNQTIMFALSLVVIAGLIGGRGLGDVVTNGLYSNAALAILAGIAIVIMAIALDRATSAIAERTDPTRQHLTDRGKRRAACHARDLRRDPRDRASWRARSARTRSTRTSSRPRPPSTRPRSTRTCCAGSSRCSTTCRTRPRSSSGSPSRSGTSCSSTSSSRCASCSWRSPWFIVLGGLTAIAFVLSGLRPAVTALVHARGDRRDGRVGGGDGHRLAGARGDRARRAVRHRDRGLGGGEPARGAASCGRCSTRSRRFRSSSTSSRSST